MPWVKLQFFTNNGDPAAGFKVFVYEAGTSTKAITYSDFALTTPNTNPIVLDSAGRAVIFLAPTTYKFILALPTDSDPPTSPIWTQDDVPSLSPFASNLDVAGTAGEVITANEVVYLSDGSGGATAGRWYKADADQTYSSTAAISIGIAMSNGSVAGSVTVRRNGTATGLSGLTVGGVHYVSTTAGALTSAAPTNAIVVGKADSTTSLILGANWGLAGSASTGLIGTGAQTFAGAKTFTTQPQTYIGTAVTLPATVGGLIYSDVALHSVVASSTDSVMSDTEIPANALNANGKAVLVRFGSSVAMTGANTKTIELDVGGTQISLYSSATNPASFWAEFLIVRIDSDSVDVSGFMGPAGSSQGGTATRINSLTFTAAIDLRTLGTTGAASTLSQTFLTVEAIG